MESSSRYDSAPSDAEWEDEPAENITDETAETHYKTPEIDAGDVSGSHHNDKTATPSSTPVRSEKIANMQCSAKMLSKVISQLEENNKNMGKIYLLVKKHEEILSQPKANRERNKYVPITVRVSGYFNYMNMKCMHAC